MTFSNPTLSDSFEESLSEARQRERKRFRLVLGVCILGLLAFVGLAYSWSVRLSTVQEQLQKSQGDVEILRTAAASASTLATNATASVASIDAISKNLSKTIDTEQAIYKKEISTLRLQLAEQEKTRSGLEKELVTLSANLNTANDRLRSANNSITETTNRVAVAVASANQASTAASAAIQSAQAASNTAAVANTTAQAVQTQAREVTLSLTELRVQAENRFLDIERSLRRAHYTFNTSKANQILIDGSLVFLYFGHWNERENAVTNLCVATTKVKSNPPSKGFILTRPFRQPQPSQQDCLLLSFKGPSQQGPTLQDVNGSLALLRIGESVTFLHDNARYTVTPRFRIKMPILHDQIGFDVEREPVRPSP